MRPRLSVFAASVLVVLSGCAGEGASSGVDADDAPSAVVRSADERAERAGIVMTRWRDGTAADMTRAVTGGEPDLETAIEALIAEGDPYNGRIVLRITERSDSDPGVGEPEHAVRCYEYQLRNSTDDYVPALVACPDGEPLELAPVEPEPKLPEGVEDALREALGAIDPENHTEEAVLGAAQSVAGSAPRLEVTTLDGVIGAAVGNGADECVAASIDAGSIEVWRIPRIMMEPGEVGCSAAHAAQGRGKRPPH